MSEVVLRIITLERHDWFKHKDGSGRGKTISQKKYVVEKPETLLKCVLGMDKNGFPKKLAEQITLYL
jgi:hypothetical protein